MAKAARALLLLVCLSATWLLSSRADVTQPQAALGQHLSRRALQQYIPTEITYSIENGINYPHLVKYKSE
jgi:hypothetical protein